ncbi:MAG: hypothetical protein WCL37_07275 [Chrysiogenales bacterium]
MNIKKTILIILVILLSVSLLSAATYKKPIKRGVAKTFVMKDMYLTPQIGLYSGAVPFGANIELALTENIGVGATLMMWFGSGYSVFMPQVDAAYHFTMLEVDKLDLFAGVGVGFAIAGSGGGTSGIAISPFIAVRYWFSEKMGISLRSNIGIIGDWTGVSSMLGVVFNI